LGMCIKWWMLRRSPHTTRYTNRGMLPPQCHLGSFWKIWSAPVDGGSSRKCIECTHQLETLQYIVRLLNYVPWGAYIQCHLRVAYKIETCTPCKILEAILIELISFDTAVFICIDWPCCPRPHVVKSWLWAWGESWGLIGCLCHRHTAGIYDRRWQMHSFIATPPVKPPRFKGLDHPHSGHARHAHQ
jgi:hypothetical protein